MQAAPRSQQSLKEASDDIEASVSVDSTAVSGGHVPKSRSGENLKGKTETGGNEEAIKKTCSF
jgi:hypothetical protein